MWRYKSEVLFFSLFLLQREAAERDKPSEEPQVSAPRKKIRKSTYFSDEEDLSD